MKAIAAFGADDLRIVERQRPEAETGRPVVRIAYGGICGSDLHYAAHGRNGVYSIQEPLVLGHEVVGVVAKSDDDSSFRPGDPVAVHPATPTPEVGARRGSGLNLAIGGTYLGSASTSPHTQGGFVEYLGVSEQQLRRIPDGLPLRLAVLAEPLAVALHAVGLLGDRVSGSRVLVSGAGPIGVLAVAALRRAGASSITVADLHQKPLDTAISVGADEAVRIGGAAELRDDDFDVVVEAAGAVASLKTALRVVRRGGAVLQLGMLPAGDLSVPLAALVSKEVALQGTQRFDSEFDEAIALLAEQPNIGATISHAFPLDDALSAFACAADSTLSSKVIIEVTEDPQLRSE